MIDIKRITAKDALRLAEINALFAELSPGSVNGIEEADAYEALSNPNFFLFVAIQKGDDGAETYVGTGSIFFQRNLERWIAEIHDVVVFGEYRGQGIGKLVMERLLQAARDFSESKGMRIELCLTSRPSRVAANSLYQNLGFALVAKADGPKGTNLYKIIVEPQGLRCVEAQQTLE